MKRRRFITKRTCIMLMLLLVGGAIVNVAVAWGCVARSQPLTVSIRWQILDLADYASLRLQEFVPQYVNDQYSGLITSEWRHSTGVVETWFQPCYNHSFSGFPDYFAMRRACGWPLLCLEGLAARPETMRANGANAIRTVWAWNLDPSAHWLSYSFVPLRPIWPGFAINTVFYAAVLWGLFAVPMALGGLRKRRRINRGWCPKCAYDLRGRAPSNAVCPECGAAGAR